MADCVQSSINLQSAICNLQSSISTSTPSLREAGLAEVGLLGARRMAVDEVGVTSDDEQRCQPGRHDILLADVEVRQVELIECSKWRGSCQLDSKRKLERIVFGQETASAGD